MKTQRLETTGYGLRAAGYGLGSALLLMLVAPSALTAPRAPNAPAAHPTHLFCPLFEPSTSRTRWGSTSGSRD